jgi:RNA polymerase sigma factor (sigma-70 family)
MSDNDDEDDKDDVPDSAPAELWDSTIQVLERARAGDRSAARMLLERALPPLKRWTHGRIPGYARGTADTEDVVQDAVVQTLKRIEKFEHRTVGALQAYLRTSVFNRIRDIVRVVKRRGVPLELPEDLPEVERGPFERVLMRENLDRFLEALRRLRPADRQMIVWRVELGYSYEEIATRAGKPSAAAARMAVSRALERLAKEMGMADPAAGVRDSE